MTDNETESKQKSNPFLEKNNLLDLVEAKKKRELLEENAVSLKNYQIIGYSDSGKPILAAVRPREIKDMLLLKTGGWPKRLGDALFVKNEIELTFLRDGNLLPWVMTFMDVDWQEKSGFVSKTEFHRFLGQTCENYRAVYNYPVFPERSDIYVNYSAAPNGSQDGGMLDKFIDFFLPASELDRKLIKAFILTAFWSNTSGKKPLFLICADTDDEKNGRGVGKTTLVNTIAALAGGYIDANLKMSQKELFESIAQQSHKSIVRFDNVKKQKVSLDVLEALITSDEVQGRVNYTGFVSMANKFTVAMTYNNPSLSQDLAERSIMIQLRRPEAYDASWAERLETFVKENRAAIYESVRLHFELPITRIQSNHRFSLWFDQIAARAGIVSEDVSKIKQASAEINADEEDATFIEDALLEALGRYVVPYGQHYKPWSLELGCPIIVPKSILTRMLHRVLGNRDEGGKFRAIERANLPFIAKEELKTTYGRRCVIIYRDARENPDYKSMFQSAWMIQYPFWENQSGAELIREHKFR